MDINNLQIKNAKIKEDLEFNSSLEIQGEKLSKQFQKVKNCYQNRR